MGVARTLSKPSPPPPAHTQPLAAAIVPSHVVHRLPTTVHACPHGAPQQRASLSRVMPKQRAMGWRGQLLRWVVAVMAMVMARADYHAGDFIPTARKGQFQGVRPRPATRPPFVPMLRSRRRASEPSAARADLRRDARSGVAQPPAVPRGWMSTPQRVRGQGRW